jgi:hypothetical protein
MHVPPSVTAAKTAQKREGMSHVTKLEAGAISDTKPQLNSKPKQESKLGTRFHRAVLVFLLQSDILLKGLLLVLHHKWTHICISYT